MPLYRVVAAYRTDAQEILLVLEHGETIYRVEGDADIVCADLEEARLAHCQGTPRLAPALLLAWRWWLGAVRREPHGIMRDCPGAVALPGLRRVASPR